MAKTRAATALAALLIGCASQPEDQLQSSDLTFHQKPQITIDSPAPGSFVAPTADGTIEVSGKANGKSIAVNGQSVSVDGQGAFRARIAAATGINVIDAHLNSLWGGELQRAFHYGKLASPQAGLPHGVIVRATAQAFDDGKDDLNDFSSISRAMLQQLDVAQVIRQLPPLTYDFGSGSVDVAVTDVQFDRSATALSLSPGAGGAHARGSFSRVAISVRLVLHLNGDHATNGTITLDTAGFAGDINAAYSAQARAIVASMARPEIALGRIGVTTDLQFSGVDDFLTWLANTFKDVIANAVASQIQGSAANHFAVSLNQIGLPSIFSLQPYGLSAMIKSTSDFDAASFDGAGATLSATTNFSWPPARGAPGSLVLGSSPTSAFAAAPFAVSVSFDALNQAAFAVWGQNGLVRTVVPAKDFKVFKLDAVVASPRLPPVLVPTRDGRVQISLGDVVVKSAVHTWIFDGPLQATVSAVADVVLDVDPRNGALRMKLAGKPSIQVDVNDLLGIVPDALLAPLSEALQAIAPTVVEKIVTPIEVPLPRLPLAKLIQGSKASLGLSPPVAVSVDSSNKRVNLSGPLAEYH
jgi:hypothetical protein